VGGGGGEGVLNPLVVLSLLSSYSILMKVPQRACDSQKGIQLLFYFIESKKIMRAGAFKLFLIF
jgi:hypothetical protein